MGEISIRHCKRCGNAFKNEDNIEDMKYCSDECYLADNLEEQ